MVVTNKGFTNKNLVCACNVKTASDIKVDNVSIKYAYKYKNDINRYSNNNERLQLFFSNDYKLQVRIE